MLRLLPLLQASGAHADAVAVARSALAAVGEMRGEMIVRLAELGVGGAPSCSAASVLAADGGDAAAPYRSAADAVEQALGCVHADLLVALFRSNSTRASPLPPITRAAPLSASAPPS